jgi:D-threo-aldose 1-dehydrogenase
MSFSASQRRALGMSGIDVPPIMFGSAALAALANVPRVVPEQRKLAICGEWFRNVEPPVFIDAAWEQGDGMALEVLGRMLRRLDVAPDEVAVHLTLDSDRIDDCWNKSRLLLGSEYQPMLVSVFNADDTAWRAISQRKSAGAVRGAGIATSDLRTVDRLSPQPDWVLLTSGFSLMRHGSDLVNRMAELARERFPIIVSRLFDSGFLVGGNCLDGRVVSIDDPANRSLLAWRTSFVALCHGHGVRPAHACIQFALSGPGVAALLVHSSYPERVAANIDSVLQKVPGTFWASMKEEGLLAADYPLGA